MSTRSFDPFLIFELWSSFFEAYYSTGKKPEIEQPVAMKVVWEIGPGGYQRGHCVKA